MEFLASNRIPLWLKIGYSAFVCVLVPIYWFRYGPRNFLWFSDIALLLTVPALWLESGLLASMMALAVVLLEVGWVADFVIRLTTVSSLFGLSDYMFDSKISLGIRALSLFHIPLPLLLLWIVYRLGYDERALVAQTLLAWIVFPVSYLLTSPRQNINWVYGFGNRKDRRSGGKLHLLLLMVAVPVVVYIPTHVLLEYLF